MPDYDVFLSYSWQDQETVEAVAGELTSRKLRVFLDRWYLTPGQSWRQELEERCQEGLEPPHD